MSYSEIQPLVEGRVKSVRIEKLSGLSAYHQIWEYQRQLHRFVVEGGTETIILTQHSPVITIGKKGGWSHLLAQPDLLREKGIEIVETDRGGDITYHGPGQLVIYPILNLKGRGLNIHQFLRNLEEVIIKTLAHFDVEGFRVSGRTGVWTASGKVASIGVHIKQWVTYHGVAFNIENSCLEGFRYIVPCGLSDASMTALESLITSPISVDKVIPVVVRKLEEVFAIPH